MASGAPDIGSLIAGLGSGGPQPGGFSPQMPQMPSASPEDEPIQILQQMISLARSYMDAEPDEEDKATMAKVLATLQGYLAKDQQDRDAVLGGGPLPRLLRKG